MAEMTRISKSEAEDKVFSYLKLYAYGYRQAKNQWEIEKVIEIAARQVRRHIRELRLKGIAIGSSPQKKSHEDGYWMVPHNPNDEEKIAYNEYLKRLHDKALRVMELLKPQRIAFETLLLPKLLKHDPPVDERGQLVMRELV